MLESRQANQNVPKRRVRSRRSDSRKAEEDMADYGHGPLQAIWAKAL
jgi:hypothetical protein